MEYLTEAISPGTPDECYDWQCFRSSSNKHILGRTTMYGDIDLNGFNIIPFSGTSLDNFYCVTSNNTPVTTSGFPTSNYEYYMLSSTMFPGITYVTDQSSSTYNFYPPGVPVANITCENVTGNDVFYLNFYGDVQISSTAGNNDTVIVDFFIGGGSPVYGGSVFSTKITMAGTTKIRIPNIRTSGFFTGNIGQKYFIALARVNAPNPNTYYTTVNSQSGFQATVEKL